MIYFENHKPNKFVWKTSELQHISKNNSMISYNSFKDLSITKYLAELDNSNSAFL